MPGEETSLPGQDEGAWGLEELSFAARVEDLLELAPEDRKILPDSFPNNIELDAK